MVMCVFTYHTKALKVQVFLDGKPPVLFANIGWSSEMKFLHITFMIEIYVIVVKNSQN